MVFGWKKSISEGAKRQRKTALTGRAVEIFDSINWILLGHSISVRMVKTSGRLKIPFFKNKG